jgi:iron complex transport system permease protein
MNDHSQGGDSPATAQGGDMVREPALWAVLGGLGIALVGAVLVGVALGAVRVPVEQVVAAIGRMLAGRPATSADAVIVEVRLPRVLLAALVGACLGASGALYQALFRNSLADPYILGVSSGAGLAATATLVAGSVLGVVWASGVFAVPAAAFIGALATIALVAALAGRSGRMDTTSLLLAGVAVSYTLAAATSFLLVYFRQSMSAVVYWMMGGLTSAGWPYVGIVSVMLLVGLAVPVASTRALDIILLGDERAAHLGVDVRRLKWLVLASASLLVAAAVAVSGLIGFVGLMTAHMVRLAFGPRHRILLPASVLGGAIMLVLADVIARTVVAPVELPVGIVTAAFGGPFFLWLLVRGETR